MSSAALAALSLGGTIISAFGQHKAAKAEHEASLNAAEEKRLSALELEERSEFNQKFITIEGKKVIAAQKGSFIKGGVEISEGSPLSVLEETNMLIEEELQLEKMMSEFSVSSLLRQADQQKKTAGDVRKARKLELIGTLIGGGSRTALAAQR